MSFISKKKKIIMNVLNKNNFYSFNDAYDLLCKIPFANFKNSFESFDVAVSLGIDTNRSEQNVRGSVVLPNGNGKVVKIAVFSDYDKEELIKNGADFVGIDYLMDQVSKGNILFDVMIADTDSMKIISKLGPILGPKGLMPNPKNGTVTKDLIGCIQKIKSGQIIYKTDKYGIVHSSVGRVNFDKNKIKINIESLLGSIKKNKPVGVKGVYIKKISLSTTMGPGLFVDLSSFVY